VWTLPRHRVAAEDASYRKFAYYRYSPSLPWNYSRNSLYDLGEQQKAMSKLQVADKMSMVAPNKSPEPTAVGAGSSAIAVHVASRRWLSFFR
jgi:hypothetical protein